MITNTHFSELHLTITLEIHNFPRIVQTVIQSSLLNKVTAGRITIKHVLHH